MAKYGKKDKMPAFMAKKMSGKKESKKKEKMEHKGGMAMRMKMMKKKGKK